MVFNSKSDWMYKGVILLLISIGVIGAFFIYLDKNSIFESLWFFLVFSLFAAFNFQMKRATKYRFESDALICKTWISKKTIPYAKIKLVKPGKSIEAGSKMALTFRGLILMYNEYDDLFISPVEESTFIAELLKRNPNIKTKNAQ